MSWPAQARVFAYYMIFVVVTVALYPLIGLWSFLPGAASSFGASLIPLWRHGLQPGEYWCVIWGRGAKVHHYHWPHREIVDCHRSRGFGRSS